MQNIRSAIVVVLILSVGVWLFLNDQAAQPGLLSRYHRDVGRCPECHEPWRGVSEGHCLSCHEFGDVSDFRGEIRFHESQSHCLACHKEHGILGSAISVMDHRLLNSNLLCTDCHFDRHAGLFGNECRECHGIGTWAIPDYRHPRADRTDCHRCHEAPYSHRDARFWELILADMGKGRVSHEDCWRCHTILHWSDRIMEHELTPLGHGTSGDS